MDVRGSRTTRRLGPWGGAVVALLAVAGCSDSPMAPAGEEASRIVLDQELVTADSHREVLRFYARVYDGQGHEMAGVPLAWSVDDSGVLEALGDGAFRTLGDGTANVTVRLAGPLPSVSGDGYEDQAPHATGQVRVKQVAARLGLFVGDSLVADEDGFAALVALDIWAVDERPILSARPVDAQGQALVDTAPPAEVSWQTQDPGVLTLDGSGTVLPVGDGDATILVQGEGLSGELPVRVRTTQEVQACAGATAPTGSGPDEAMEQCASVILTFVRGR